MNEDAIREKLGTFVGSWLKVRLTRAIPSDPRHNGFVVAVGRDWVLLQQFHDFYPEGYAALRVKDITDIRSNEYERLWERMLAAEGILDQLTLPYDVPLEDIQHLLTALQRRGDNIIVECEDANQEIEDFYIGQVLSLDDDSLSFANFDALGRWDDAPDTIPFNEITQVQFETPYVRIFSKYLQGRAAKPGASPNHGGV
jgi:hypothetical protein